MKTLALNECKVVSGGRDNADKCKDDLKDLKDHTVDGAKNLKDETLDHVASGADTLSDKINALVERAHRKD